MLWKVAALLGALGTAAAAETLAGKVVEDHSNNPLASVELRVYREGVPRLAAELETGPDGRFNAAGLPGGDYRIELSKPNYISTVVRLHELTGGLLVRLVRCGVIAGQVVDGQGRPVSGATVYAMPKPAGGGPFRLFASPERGSFTQVGERGQYRLHTLPPGEYAVAVTYGASTAVYGSTGGAAVREGLGSGAQFYPVNTRPQTFAIAGGEDYRNIDFTIIPTTLYRVRGKLELPAPNTKYWLALTTQDQPSLATAVAATDNDGSFQFDGVAAGNYNLTAAGPVRGYGGRAVLGPEPLVGRTQISVGGNVEGVAVPVQKGRSLSFVLRSATPESAGGCPATASLKLSPLEDWAADLDRAAEVNFQTAQPVTDLAPSRFQLVVQRLGEACYQPEPAILDLTGEAPKSPIAVLVAPAGVIHGKLTGAAKPEGFAVALVSSDTASGAQPVQVTIPGADGRFTFGGLRPGRYLIAAQPAGEASKARWLMERARMTEIPVTAGAPTEVELSAPPANPNQ